MADILNVYLDDKTHRRLQFIAKELGRPEVDLAECSISEAALDFFKGRNDDPAEQKPMSRKQREANERDEAHRNLEEDDMPGGFN